VDRAAEKFAAAARRGFRWGDPLIALLARLFWRRSAVDVCQRDADWVNLPRNNMTSTPLTLCDFPAKTGLAAWDSFSPFVLKVARALRLSKLPFEHRHIDMMKLKQLNPIGQLPVLLVGEERVADSTQILRRIEALAPGSLTGGVVGAQLAEAWLWEEFADTALYPYVLATRWDDDRGWPVPRDAFFGSLPAPVRLLVAPMVRRQTRQKLRGRDFTRGGLAACYDRMHNVLDQLDARAPDTGFWLGPTACIADIGLFGQLHSLRLPLIPWQAEAVAKRQRLSAYLDRVDQATR
jgi:glutathione S-transferase